MNKTDTERMIEVMQAFVDGKEIQWSYRHRDSDWEIISANEVDEIDWDFECCDFRLKPEPRVIYVNEYPPPGRYGCCYESAIEAETSANPHALRIAVKYQEVIE